MNKKAFTRRSAATALLLVGALSGGVAIASWTQNGSGSGAALAKTAVASVVSAGTTTADLYPGQTTGTLSMSITNPNPYPVTFTNATMGSVTVDSTHSAGCTTTGLSFSTPTVSLLVPANSVGTALSAPIVAMSNASSNGCQGATFTIAVTLTGSS
ncbi:MAG: hypothetical protein NVSMB13_12590 [Mycobacteriales bacterium]